MHQFHRVYVSSFSKLHFFFLFFILFLNLTVTDGATVRSHIIIYPQYLLLAESSYEAHIGCLSKMIYRNLAIIGCHVTVGALKEHGIFPCKVSFTRLTPSLCSSFFALARSFVPFRVLFWKRLLRRLSDACTNRFVEISCSVEIGRAHV